MSFLSTSSPVPKKTAASGTISSVPSPTPSNASGTGDAKKRKRELPAYQPNDFHGANLWTQITHVVEWLKKKDAPVSLDDIINYLNIPQQDAVNELNIRRIIQGHEKLEFVPEANNGKGGYRFRPKHNVRSADQLKGYLQRQKTSLGIPVKDLKEGWPGALDAINILEQRGELLVVRNRKENTPKVVWQNDPSLSLGIDEHFQKMWSAVAIPQNEQDLRAKLEAAGLKPTTAPSSGILAGPAGRKKKKAPRRGGRQTNTHMLGILKDYSHKRK